MRVVNKPVPYAVMFQQVKQRRHGLDKTEAISQWKDFLKKNPKCGRLGED